MVFFLDKRWRNLFAIIVILSLALIAVLALVFWNAPQKSQGSVFNDTVLHAVELAVNKNTALSNLAETDEASLLSLKEGFSEKKSEVAGLEESAEQQASILLLAIFEKKIELELISRELDSKADEIDYKNLGQGQLFCNSLPSMRDLVSFLGETYSVALDLSSLINEYNTEFSKQAAYFPVEDISPQVEEIGINYFESLAILEEQEVACNA